MKKQQRVPPTKMTEPNHLQKTKLAKLVYLPNILGYLRIFLSIYSLHWFSESVEISQAGGRAKTTLHAGCDFTFYILVAAFLDVIDGPIARYLHQTSTFGIYLDIIADNVCRSCSWIAVCLVQPQLVAISIFFIFVEWITLFASQVSKLHGPNLESNVY